MKIYNSWRDNISPVHIKKILKGEKGSPNILSSKKYLDAEQDLTEMSIGDFIMCSEKYMYTNYHEKLREQIFSSFSEDLIKDMSFIMRIMACNGLGYIEESTLGEYYPFINNMSSMPRGLDIFCKYFNNEVNNNFIDKNLLESIKAFLIHNNFEKLEDKKYLIDFISSNNLNKDCLFLSSFMNIFNKKYFPESEYEEKINQKILFEIGKMNIEQINRSAIEVHGHICLQISKNGSEDCAIKKDVVLAIMDRWKNLIIKSGKTELVNNIYFMNIIDNNFKSPDLILSKEHLEKIFIIEESNKDSVKVIANSNLICAAIKMSMQKTIDDKKSSLPIYLNVNNLYKVLEIIFKNNKKEFKDILSVDDMYFEKKNPDANVVGTLTVKIDKDKNALDNAKRIQEYLLNCMVLLFSNLSIRNKYENLEDDCLNFLEKAFLKQDLDNLTIGKEITKRKTLKF